jgi:hypothetical protein
LLVVVALVVLWVVFAWFGSSDGLEQIMDIYKDLCDQLNKIKRLFMHRNPIDTTRETKLAGLNFGPAFIYPTSIPLKLIDLCS